MPSNCNTSNAIIDRLARGLIGLWRIMVGLIAAMILAPVLTGLLCGLIMAPTDSFDHYVREVGVAILLFLFIGISASFQSVIYVVVPGIILLRWFGVMSRLLCIIGGSVICMFPFSGFFGFTISPLPIDWRLLGTALCGGGLAGWIYWWLAERPLRSTTQDALVQSN